jgi:hypothetical protein
LTEDAQQSRTSQFRFAERKQEEDIMPLPESGNLVLTLFDELINRVKSSQPITTDGKSLTLGFVYSQLPLGMMVDKNDYINPWSPMGGAPAGVALGDGGGAAAAPAGGGAAGAKPAPDPKFKKAIEAAYKVSSLVDNMLMVSKDNKYIEYPTQRKISFGYESILFGMQPLPMPPIAPEIQKQINDSQAILYVLDQDGNITGKSDLYKRYLKNSSDYALAKKQYADAQTKALADPQAADSWPQDSVYYQNQVDEAYDTFKTEGAEKIERALAIIESIGIPMQDHMIAQARKTLDAWKLGIAGVPVSIPYSYVSPTNWADPDDDDEGWQHLVISQDDYHSHAESHSSSTSAAGSFLGFIDIGASGSSNSNSNSFHNDSQNLSIDLEYGIVTIYRPWLIGDLFYLRNWYLVNNPAKAISDGTIDGQNQSAAPLLPMIPNQFLVIRNVKISSSNWNNDGLSIQNKISGGGGFSLGFLSFGASHSQTDTSDDLSGHFDGTTLSIRGAQIVAWLSEIVPACAPLDDPGLKKK